MDQHNLSSLPNELLQEIFDDLPITDCQSIRDAHAKTTRKGDFENIYNDRVSLHRYFTNHGLDGKKMVNILANSHAFIIGSRALEFFVPESIASESDWNFFMEYSPPMIYEFMTSMEKMGVVWNSLDRRIYIRMIYDCKDICARPNEMINAIETLRQKYDGLDPETEDLIHTMQYLTESITSYSDGSGWIKLWYNDDGSIEGSIIPEDQLHTHTDEQDDVFGRITIDGIQFNVTLSFSEQYQGKGRLMQFLHKFPLSILQCTISGFGAIHLYGKEACKQMSYKWEAPSFGQIVEKGSRARELVVLYLDRGFDIRYQPWKKSQVHTARSSNENGCIRILCPAYHNWDTDFWKEMQHQYLDIKWAEMCTDTIHIPNPDSGNLPKELSEMMHKFESVLSLKLNTEYLQSYGVM
jgi:hypothetical protein